MSEYYDGGADHATYEGHDAYEGDQHDGHGQYADVQEQVHHVIELIGDRIDGIEHDAYEAKDGAAYEEPKEHDGQQAYASDEYQADDHKADDYQADYKGDEHKGYEQYSPYARS
ncbi:hypothetical protein AB0K00_21255 [Dactylosporangium sp. NPDC049525]|uniref:hypothetical protein n=1 Tax=Dactylosporangium sp. NPDC049525 TaxID=3154730 RepID=UPI003421CA43